jgi:hypothetical protein
VIHVFHIKKAARPFRCWRLDQFICEDLLGHSSGLLGGFNHMVVCFGHMLMRSFHVGVSGGVVIGTDALGSFFV